jgi:hypothetical protein
MSLALSGMLKLVDRTMKVKQVGSGNPAIFCSNACSGFASVLSISEITWKVVQNIEHMNQVHGSYYKARSRSTVCTGRFSRRKVG